MTITGNTPVLPGPSSKQMELWTVVSMQPDVLNYLLYITHFRKSRAAAASTSVRQNVVGHLKSRFITFSRLRGRDRFDRRLFKQNIFSRLLCLPPIMPTYFFHKLISTRLIFGGKYFKQIRCDARINLPRVWKSNSARCLYVRFALSDRWCIAVLGNGFGVRSRIRFDFVHKRGDAYEPLSPNDIRKRAFFMLEKIPLHKNTKGNYKQQRHDKLMILFRNKTQNSFPSP